MTQSGAYFQRHSNTSSFIPHYYTHSYYPAIRQSGNQSNSRSRSLEISCMLETSVLRPLLSLSPVETVYPSPRNYRPLYALPQVMQKPAQTRAGTMNPPQYIARGTPHKTRCVRHVRTVLYASFPTICFSSPFLRASFHSTFRSQHHS